MARNPIGRTLGCIKVETERSLDRDGRRRR